MTIRQLSDMIDDLLRLNPDMAEMPVLGPNGGDAKGLGIDGRGLAILEDYRPQVRDDSSQNYFEAILRLAGFKVLAAHRLENGYWPDTYIRLRAENPWWLFETEHGLIKMGWRKRVISLSWNFVHVVPTEDVVTKDQRSVHAWSPEKAVEYLRNVRLAAETKSAA